MGWLCDHSGAGVVSEGGWSPGSLGLPSVVILEPKKIKSDTVPLFPHLFPMKRWDRTP